MSGPSSIKHPLEQCEGTDRSPIKRKRSSTSCHQCHKKREGVIQCNNCTNQYCMRCANKWYPKIEEALFENCCSICSDICNCGACLQSNRPSNIQNLNARLEEIYDLSAHVINVLFPTLKKHAEEADTQDEKVLELLGRAEAILSLNESTLETRCSCLNSEAPNKASVKAASREDGGNYLYYPVAAEIENSDIRHFLTHLYNGEPVIVQGVVPSGPVALSWEPGVIKRAIHLTSKSWDINVKNSSREEKVEKEETIITNIFEAYRKGLFDRRGDTKIPPVELRSFKTFVEQLPRHCRELVRCLPFKQYTHSVPGVPVSISVSYGPRRGTEQRASITTLQYGVYDRSCIRVAVDLFSPKSLSESESLFERRRFTSDDFQKENKLMMKKLLLDRITQAVEYFEKIPRKLSEETVSTRFLKQRAMMMRLLLERAGPKVPPAVRNKLEYEIQNFINKCSART